MYNSFKPGAEWLDTNGNLIQAHGASVFYWNGKYWWVGENKEKSETEFEVWHWGVRLYSSTDLYNWQDEGIICPPEVDKPGHPFHPQSKMDRPHILLNDQSGEFVMWVKIMEADSQYYVVLRSKDIHGPYEIVNPRVDLGGIGGGDFDLVKSDDGAYIMFERVHSSMICWKLDDNYYKVTDVKSEFWAGRTVPFVREAPAVFNKGGKWYMFTSGTTAKFPNPSESASAGSLMGPWTEYGRCSIGDVKDTTFDSQISCVFNVQGTDLYIAIADRWLIDLKPDLPDMMKIFDTMFNHRTPDFKFNLKDYTTKPTKYARYVWLPVEFVDGAPKVRWYDEWKISDFVK